MYSVSSAKKKNVSFHFVVNIVKWKSIKKRLLARKKKSRHSRDLLVLFYFCKFYFQRKKKKKTPHRLFGIGTWLNLNGIWVQLPLLIPKLSEGWALSPQLGMASNIANVGPLVIAVIRQIIGQSSAYEVPSICVIFAVGITVPLILSFTWFKQVYFLGRQRSLYLLILGFFLALVNCTSSVTYLPFVNRFDPKWLNIYFAGESLSSLIPAALGLAQVNLFHCF